MQRLEALGGSQDVSPEVNLPDFKGGNPSADRDKIAGTVIGSNESVYKEIDADRDELIDARVAIAEKRVRVEYDVQDIMLPLRAGTVTARFLGYCRMDEETGCWVWRGAFSDKGAPQMSVFKRVMESRRIGYELFAGNTHHWNRFTMDCDNEHCVNPAHMQRYRHKKRVTTKRGYTITKDRKLTQADVDTIRASIASNEALAKRFGVSTWTIWSIKSGRRWAKRHSGSADMIVEDTMTGRRRDKIAALMKSASILADLEAKIVEEESAEFQNTLKKFTKPD
jgi:hypothetical protein